MLARLAPMTCPNDAGGKVTSPWPSTFGPSSRALASTSCGPTTSSKTSAPPRPPHAGLPCPQGLIIDEFGVWPYDRIASTALFTLISDRYERGSIILTSNKGFAEWGDVFSDSVIAAAILDRLLHHSHVLNIRGDSWCLREKKRAGFFGAPPAGQDVMARDQTDPLDPGWVISQTAPVGHR